MSEEPGVWDYEESTELDNIAYLLYIKKNNELAKTQESWAYYRQTSFIDSVGHKKYYEEAKIIQRKYKIDRINGIR